MSRLPNPSLPTLQSLADGRFRLDNVLGEGGVAVVYESFDTLLKVPRAIKLLRPGLAQHARARARFTAEAQTMARLTHPNIVRIFDVGMTNEHAWIVMELVSGGSLIDWLKCHGPMPPQMAVGVCIEVLRALELAHQEDVIHRDIKPHNILLTAEGQIQVTDFGIARTLQQPEDMLTRTGATMGTWAFMAPEQRADAKGVDATADIYSVGATLFALVTGETPVDLFAADLNPAILANLPEELTALIRKATRYQRSERFLNAMEMIDAATEIMAALPDSPLPPHRRPSNATPTLSPDQETIPEHLQGQPSEISTAAVQIGSNGPLLVPPIEMLEENEPSPRLSIENPVWTESDEFPSSVRPLPRTQWWPALVVAGMMGIGIYRVTIGSPTQTYTTVPTENTATEDTTPTIGEAPATAIAATAPPTSPTRPTTQPAPAPTETIRTPPPAPRAAPVVHHEPPTEVVPVTSPTISTPAPARPVETRVATAPATVPDVVPSPQPEEIAEPEEETAMVPEEESPPGGASREADPPADPEVQDADEIAEGSDTPTEQTNEDPDSEADMGMDMGMDMDMVYIAPVAEETITPRIVPAD